MRSRRRNKRKINRYFRRESLLRQTLNQVSCEMMSSPIWWKRLWSVTRQCIRKMNKKQNGRKMNHYFRRESQLRRTLNQVSCEMVSSTIWWKRLWSATRQSIRKMNKKQNGSKVNHFYRRLTLNQVRFKGPVWRSG